MKQLTKFFAMVLALVMTMSLLGGCEEKPEPLQWPEIAPQNLENESLTGDWNTETALLSFDGGDRFWFTENTPNGVSMEGRYLFDGLELWLRDRDGVVYRGCLDREGNLTLDEYPGAFAYKGFPIDPAILGDWQYQLGDLTLHFSEEGEFQWNNRGQTGEGIYTYNGSMLSLFEDGQNLSDTGYLDEDGCLYLDTLGGWFYQEGGITYKPLSPEEERLIAPDRAPDLKRIPMENGAVSYQPEKGVYAPYTAEWVVAQSELTPEKEGNRAVAVVGSCFQPYKYIPNLTGEAMSQMEYVLYDRYTGLIFPSVDSHLDEDGRYHYEFDSRDGRVELSVHLENIFEGPTGDCFGIMSVILQIEMPQWYDGLAFAALPVPETYEQLQHNNSMPRVAYNAYFLRMDPQRIQNSLKFYIQ